MTEETPAKPKKDWDAWAKKNKWALLGAGGVALVGAVLLAKKKSKSSTSSSGQAAPAAGWSTVDLAPNVTVDNIQPNTFVGSGYAYAAPGWAELSAPQIRQLGARERFYSPNSPGQYVAIIDRNGPIEPGTPEFAPVAELKSFPQADATASFSDVPPSSSSIDTTSPSESAVQ